MKKENKSIFLMIILILSALSLSFTPHTIADEHSNLLSVCMTNDKIYVHDGTSENIIDSFDEPGATIQAITFDGTNIITADWSTDLIYVHNGISESVNRTFATPYDNIEGLTFDGTNLISCDGYLDIITVHDGISAAVLDEWGGPGSSANGLAFDGTNLIVGDGGTVYIMVGVSNVIDYSFSMPYGASLTGITYDSTNLITVAPNQKKIFVHDGKTAVLLDSFTTPGSGDPRWTKGLAFMTGLYIPYPMEYVFTNGTESVYEVAYDNLDGVGPIEAATSHSSTVTGYGIARKLVRTSNGDLHLVYHKPLTASQIYVTKSEDDGATWIENTLISTLGGMNTKSQTNPSIAVDSNDVLHVTWTGRSTSYAAENQIWYRNYTDSWGTIRRLSVYGGMQSYPQGGPSIATDSQDYLHVTWAGKATGFTSDAQFWYMNRTDSWQEPPTRINNGADMEDWPVSEGTVTVDGQDVVHAAFSSKATGYDTDNQIWYTNSKSGWATCTRISTLAEMQDEYQTAISIAVDSEDYIYIAWSGEAVDYRANEQIWINKYTTEWGGPIRISTYAGMNLKSQDYPSIGVEINDYIYVLWQGTATDLDDEEKIWQATYTTSWADPICLQPIGKGTKPNLRWSRFPGEPSPSPPTWDANVTLAEIVGVTDDETLDVFDWGSGFGDSQFWYLNNSANVSAAWVFEGKRRYHFQVDYENDTLSTVKQIGLRFKDETNQVHTIWYDRDANTLTVTSPFDGISGWIHSFTQTGTDVVAIFQIMFNVPIPDSYDVQVEVRIVATTDSGWLTPSGGLFHIYNLGGLSTLYHTGTAGRVTGGDVLEIYAADTRTRNIIPIQDFDVRYVPLQEGWQVLGIQLQEAGDEQALLEEVEGWKWWLSTRTVNQTIHPTNRKPEGAGTDDVTYVSYPFGLKIKANPTSTNGLLAEKQFFRKITPSDNELVTVQVQAMTPQTTGTTGKILVTDDGYVDDLNARAALESLQVVDLVFAGNGSIRLTNGTAGYIYPATYTGMTWYNFTFIINCTAQSYDMYVDEVLNATGVDFRQKVSGADSVGHITFMDMSMTGNFTEFYIDDVWVHTDFDADYGGIAEATMLFDMNQHWSMDFDFYVESGQVYAQGASGTPQRVDDDYSDYGYVELGWDIMINKTLVHDFLVARVNITDGHISGKNNWIQFNVSWYKRGVYVKNDLLYGLFEGYSIYPGGERDTSGFHWDIWFNRANASTVIGARINTEFYGMSDKAVWWAIWSSKWTPMRSEVSESTLFIDLEDENGTIHSASDVSFVRSWVQVYRNTLAQFSYKVLNIAGLDFLIARDTMSGIDTPPIRETVVPDIISGFFGSALGSIFSAALKRLGNTLAGFGMGFFSMSIDFIDNIFAALGYPALVSTIFGWMDSLFASVPTLVGYGITMIGQIFDLVNTSAGNTLTQLTSIITIWVGMYSTMMDFLNGVITPGFNLWNDLGISSFIQVGAIMYPLWLLILASEKGIQAVIDHLTGVLNIASFFLNFILNVGGFFMSLLTGLIGAIRG